MSTNPLLVIAITVLTTSSAQALEVIPVPWVATDPTVPHLAYNGHATTFKAIARGGNGTYDVEWDFDGDGTFDFSAAASSRYDLSTRFTYPTQTSDVTFLASVRVTSGIEVAYGTYPVRVFADVPSDPAVATDRQLQIMRSVAIDDGLWFLHTQMERSGDETHPLTGAQITGWVDPTAGQATDRVISTGSFLEALGHNLHFPAFPAAYLGEMPDPAANVARWATDPYAEDAARLVNYLMVQATVVTVAAADEVNLVGFWPETSATPIPGTDDGIGLYLGPWTGHDSNALRGIAVSNLTGFVAQVGDANRILGRRFEFIAQQLVDALVWAQNDGGTYPGSWYYSPNTPADMLGEYAGGTLDAVEALWEAERSLARHGVIVPNLVKARNTSYIFQNATACLAGGLGGTYTASGTLCDFGYSPAILFSLGWVDANACDATDTRYAFPSYNGITRGQLRTEYDGALLWINTVFNAVTPGYIGWDYGFVEGADFGRADGLGDLWAMLHWTRAARAVAPEIVLYDTNDHARLFARFLVTNQAANGGWTWTLSTVLKNYNDSSLGPRGRAAWALLTLSRNGMVPTAVANASATSVVEGTPITFTGTAYAGDATFSWDLGNGATRTGGSVEYAFPGSGVFPVTLTVMTPAGTSTDTLSVTVTPADADADGLPDSWELLYFGGTAAQSGGGDPDADGLTNAQEWAAGLDPTSWDGPGVPTLLAPSCASNVTTAQPTLLVGNAIDPTGATLTYEFELYGDAAMSVPVTAGHAVPAGAGFTAWQVDVVLTEDATYYWRARAGNGAAFGGWTPTPCALGVDAVAPPAPEAPADPGSGCGCSGAGGSPTALFGGVIALLLRRRKVGSAAR